MSIEHRMKRARTEAPAGKNPAVSKGVLSKIKEIKQNREQALRRTTSTLDINKKMRKLLKKDGFSKIKIVNGIVISAVKDEICYDTKMIQDFLKGNINGK